VFPGRSFRLVYLVANTIMNVTTQEDQLAVFGNAAAPLEPGGCFVVEVIIPQLRRVPPGEVARAPGASFCALPYVWPSELDLMARITGFRLRER
jgi:hypothetical protein